MMTLLDQFEKALAGHDWYFQYSDDHRVWYRGKNDMENIISMNKQLDAAGLSAEATALVNKHKPATL